MRVAFLSEGATELGFAPGARADDAPLRDFFLRIVVERMLGVQGELCPLQNAGIGYLRGAGAGRLCRDGAKMVRECCRAGAEAAVIVIDRDRTAPRERWRRLDEQRRRIREDRERPVAIPVAIGVAVETIEAWLLADELALCRVLGLPNPEKPMASPEGLDGTPGEATHPKCVLNRYFARDTKQDREFLDRVAAVAREMDLDVVARMCPEGFERFRSDVMAQVGPLFSA